MSADRYAGESHDHYVDPTLEALRSCIRKLEKENLKIFALHDELIAGLSASIALQSHYASLLNMHDGGKRLEFKTVDEWLDRLNTRKNIVPPRDKPEVKTSEVLSSAG